MIRPRLIGALLLVVTFAVGGMTGMALEEALGIDWFEFLDVDSDDADASLLAGIDLTGAQRERIDEIMDREEDRLEAYWESRLPEIQSIVSASYDEIRAILDPSQRQQFEQRVRALRGRVPDEMRD